MLAKAVMDQKDQWDEFIDTTVFAYNTSCHESTCYSPFEVMFGRKAVLPIQINVDSSFDINNRCMKLFHVIYNVINFSHYFSYQYGDQIALLSNQRQEIFCSVKANIKIAQVYILLDIKKRTELIVHVYRVSHNESSLFHQDQYN